MGSTEPPFAVGDADMADDVYEALVPLDGFPKGSRGGPRPYSYEGRWWVVVSLSDFGDLIVGQWGTATRGDGLVRTRCDNVWGFGAFAVRCRRNAGHDGLHSGGSPRMVWASTGREKP